MSADPAVLRPCSVAATIAFLCLPAVATPSDVTLCDGLVSVTLPPGWREVPPEVLELYTLTMAEASGGRVTEVYQEAFQPESATELVEYPRILFQVKESGRQPYGPYLRLPRLDEVVRATGQPPDRTSGVSEPSLDQLFFDRRRFALRVSTSLTVEGTGRVGVHTASFLTERGRLAVHCFEVMDRFGSTAPLFDEVIRSVRIAPPLAYRPRLADRWPWLAALDWRFGALVGLIVSLTAALVVAVRRRCSRSSP
jgi:hypothetical protein